jgi:hypothetical protein
MCLVYLKDIIFILIYTKTALIKGGFVVDPPGIGPGPLPCHGSVIPIYYGPKEYYLLHKK